ncbi:MAG TPA: circadian clock KaiB family protein [Puia sp.]|jgi:circadian clock protein KaiB|nr:circadian clock KaiB family protein [Puia sp.]
MENKSLSEIAVKEKMILQLYTTGMSENSMLAIKNITKFCSQFLKDEVDLEIIDIYKNPCVAQEQKIVFSPSLIRQFPLPKKTLIGDLSDTKRVMLGLGITFKE